MPLSETYRNKIEGSFGVLNFRDLSISTTGNKKYIKEGLVFRSATLDNMSQEQVNEFIKVHKIKTILDLRTSTEGQDGLPIDESFPTSALERMDPAALLKESVKQEPASKAEVDTVGQETLRKKYRIDFAGKNFQRNCVFASCPLSLKLYIIYLVIFCQRQKAAYIVGKQIMSKMGVCQMYKEFAVYCQNEIREALMIFTDPDNYPIEIHCTQGKDRTGIVSALLLWITGVPEQVIVDDYAKTQKGLAPVYQEMLLDVRRSGLSDDFAQAPPQYMRELLGFLNEKYGSINNYLDTIGIDQKCRKKIQAKMCVQKE